MNVLFTGTGTSSGIPMIACDCEVCKSEDPLNKRMRASIYIRASGQRIIVDTPPDFREQCLKYDIRHVDAVVFTHAHADHVLGFDDIRRFNIVQDCRIPAYASNETMEDVYKIFDYIRTSNEVGVYRPKVDFCEIAGSFSIGEVAVTQFQVTHGPKHTSGYRFDAEGRSLGYVPDCMEISDEVVDLLRGVDVMVLDALRYNNHPTHLTVDRSVELLQRIGAERSFITHLGHDLDHKAVSEYLPDGIEPAYDGLELEI